MTEGIMATADRLSYGTNVKILFCRITACVLCMQTSCACKHDDFSNGRFVHVFLDVEDTVYHVLSSTEVFPLLFTI